MEIRQVILFIHLVSMGAYFMGLGVEVLGTLKSAGSEASAFKQISRTAARLGHYAMLVLFLTGGYLLRGVKPEDKPSFYVTILVFIVLGGLAGYASSLYKKDAQVTAKLSRSLALRVAISMSILFLVGVKPPMVESIVAVVVAAVFGAMAPIAAFATKD